jgi:broad specificity phosphatase PhoE
MPRLLLLIRHAAVSTRYAGRCYGGSNVALSDVGRATTRVVAATAAMEGGFDAVFASPSRRARLLGLHLGARLGLPVRIEPSLAERHFGAWEGQAWDDIWAAEGGDAMNGMLDAPDLYRPGGNGETTAELAARVLAWFQALPADAAVVAATHGGPIAALAGTLRGEAVRDWLRHVPAPGCGLRLEPEGSGWRTTPWQALAPREAAHA